MLRNRNISFSWISSIFVLVIAVANGLDIDSVKEGNCDEATPKIANDFNLKWATTATGKWYFPLQSKLDFYRSIEDLIPNEPLKTFNEEYAQKSCFNMRFNKPTEISISGFFGKKLQYVLSPTGRNTINFKAQQTNGETGLRSSSYVTLTDNRNYIVFINCWKDGLKSWSVASLKMQLSEKAKHKITTHLRSMGFNVNFVHEANYTYCDERGEL